MPISETDVLVAMVVLLITGSRKLSLSIGARKWVEEQIRLMMDEMQATHLVHGGAPGPDSIGGNLARLRSMDVVIYRIGGVWSLLPRGDHRGKEGRWARSGQDAGPLPRNEAMVSFASALAAKGHTVGVLGVVQEETETQGSAFTLHKAREVRLPLVREVRLPLAQAIDWYRQDHPLVDEATARRRLTER